MYYKGTSMTTDMSRRQEWRVKVEEDKNLKRDEKIIGEK
jgi:hypothetical protein